MPQIFCSTPNQRKGNSWKGSGEHQFGGPLRAGIIDGRLI
jgi:hypothetical protein